MKIENISKKLVLFAAVAFLFLGAASIVNAEETLLFEQEWFDGGTAATSAIDTANDVDYECADNFYNLSSPVDTVVIFGLTLFHDGSDWVEMTPDATEPFVVRFYADEGTDPGIEATTSGTYQICLEDSYGDGWNGGVVSVFVDGTLVLEEITLASGAGPECHDFTVNAGGYISTVYVPDEYPGENYYCIKDPSDTIIAEEGVGDETPTSIGGPNEPDWSSPVSEQALVANVTFVSLVWSDTYSLYQFNMTLDEDVDLEDGWISAQIDADNGSGTWFLWMNSLDGDLTSYQRVPAAALGRGSDNTKITSDTATLDVNGFDLALELWDITPNSPVFNIDTGEGFDTIQAAIDDNDTLDGHTIEVSAGTYAEGTLVINKSLTFLGPNAGLDGTDVARGFEAVIHYPANMTADTAGSWAPVIWIDAPDVTIDGFMITNGEADSSVNFSYFTGITNDYTTGLSNNLTLSNNIVDGDFNYISVLISAYGIGGDHLNGIEVTNNLCKGNHGLYHTIYLQDAAGTVSGNTVENCSAALQIQPYDNPYSGTVKNNDLSGFVNGIYYNYAMKGAGSWVFEENMITRADAPATGGPLNWSGIHLRTFATSGTGSAPLVDFNDNVIDGSGTVDPYWDEIRAVQIRNIDGTGIANFFANDITNSDVGVFVYADADVSSVEFTENNFVGNTDGVENLNSAVLEASCNWWDDATGPSGQGSGSGESVSVNVNYIPWLLDAYPDGECLGYPGPVTNIDTEEQFTTIQAAIDDADTLDGHTILINGITHTEGPQIIVSKNLTIKGLGCDSTVIIANGDTGNSGDARGWWLVNTGVELHLSDLTLDGTGYDIYQAIRHKGSGTIDNVCFTEIKYPTYSGVAVAAFGGGPVDITNSEFTEIGRIGVLYWITGSLFQDNNYVGKGDGDWLDYCLDIGGGGGVTVTGNTISACTGIASSDGSVSAGLLVTTYYGAGSYAIIEENNISDCTHAIAVGYDETDTSSVEAHFNNFVNCEWGISSTAPVVNGTCNWWGDISGPYDPVNNIAGLGCNVSENVTYLPWLTDLYPAGTCGGGLEALDINQSTFDRGFPIRHAIDGDWSGAQNFTPTVDSVSKVEIYTRTFGTPEFDLTVELRLNSPTGTLLDSVTFTPAEVGSSWTWLEVDFEDQNVGIGSDVFIVTPPAPSGVTTSFGYEWGYAFGDQYPGGSFWFTRDGGALWRDLPTMYEFVFKTYGF